MKNNKPHINIFIAYALQDAPILERLRKQLYILERNKAIRMWYDGMVEAGKEWAAETDRAIAEAQIILLLVSADFIASDKCYENHLPKALQKHKEGTAQVIPIIVRPCLWEETNFGQLHALSLLENTKEEAYKNVALAIFHQVKDFQLAYQLQGAKSLKNNGFAATQLQKDFKKHLAKDHLEEAIETLSSLENLEKSLKDSIDLLNSRFLLWKQYQNSQSDTPDNLKVRKELILQALHLLIDQLPPNAQQPKRKRSLFSFLPFSQSNIPSETNTFAQEKDKIRDYLIERYTERLRQKTDHRLPVSLQLTYSQEGMSADYPHFSKDIRLSEPIEGTLTQTLQKHRHLLIIGNPGAGKTTQILELAKEWLTEQVDEKLPVVFNLASWKPTDDRFHEWLQNALVSGYGFSKKLAQEAILTNQILPLLDGLDEVGKDVRNETEQQSIRNACLQAIDDYLGLLEIEYVVICSRRKEYSEIEVNAPVKAEVLVNPLTPKQIKATLGDSLTQKLSTKDENAANALLLLLEENAVLEEVLCTPFYYNIALEVFDSRSSTKDLPTTKVELEEYLVEQFIEEKLRDTPNRKGFLKEKTLKYLGWIGGMMNEEGKVVFELVDLQPRHLNLKMMQKFSIATDFFLFLIVVIFFSIIVWYLLGTKESVFFTILILFIYYFFILILLKLTNLGTYILSQSRKYFASSELLIKKIDTNKHFQVIEPKQIRTIQWDILFILFNRFKRVNLMVLFVVVWGIFIQEHYVSLYLFFCFSFYWIVIGVVLSKEASSFYNIKKPYFSFVNDARFVGLQSIVIVIVILLGGGFIVEEINVLENIAFFICAGLFWGGLFGFFFSALFKHLILRLCLFLEKKLPLQLVHFLQYATQARILEQDGGQWRFRHQILQDYFAERYGK